MVGVEVVRLLSQAGVGARALIRNPQKAQSLPGISWVSGDLSKPETLPAAFAGCDTVFLVSSIGLDTVALQHNAIEAARDAKVKHGGRCQHAKRARGLSSAHHRRHPHHRCSSASWRENGDDYQRRP
jgi:uncharacterized protein YbjT (DUF2867 family)